MLSRLPLLVLFLLLANTRTSAVAQQPGGRPDDPPGGRPGDPPGASIAIHRLSDLEFGTVTAGREREIVPSSPDAALFEVKAPPMQDIRIQWDLPAVMGGVPLYFGPNSAGWGMTSSAGQQHLFDPNYDLPLRLTSSGTIYIWLGGEANPTSQQASGPFTGEISLTITLEND